MNTYLGLSGPRVRGARGFTLIEMIVAIAIMAILVGAAVPVTQKVIAYQSRKATREELQSLSDAAAAYFRDTGRLPASIENLLVHPGGSGWAGPYLPGVVTDQITGLTGYQVDAWSRAYEVKVRGDVLTITSGGEDLAIGGADIDIRLDVTYIRREQTLEELATLNQAVRLYNGQYQLTSPLPARWSSALDQLVAKGFLPARGGYQSDGWGKDYVGDPAGKSPLVKVTSQMLSSSSSSSSSSGSTGGEHHDNGNHYGQEKQDDDSKSKSSGSSKSKGK